MGLKMRLPERHIMCDLETLSTEPDAVILSIGLARMESGNIRSIHIRPSIQEQLEVGRHISADTLAWWNDKPLDVRAAAFGEEETRVRVVDALQLVYEFADGKDWKDMRMWGNGSDFDNVILGTLYRQFKVPVPWKFYNNRCFRTVKNLSYGLVTIPEEQGNDQKHNAEADAVSQLRRLIHCGLHD